MKRKDRKWKTGRTALFAAAAVAGMLYRIIENNYEAQEYQDAIDRSVRLMRWFPASSEARESAYALLHYTEQSQSEVIVGRDFTFRSGTAAPEFSIPVEEVKQLYPLIEKTAERQREKLWRWNIYERLAETALSMDDISTAEHYYLQALEGFSTSGHPTRAAAVLLNLTELYRELEREEEAAEMAQTAYETVSPESMQKAEAGAWLSLLAAEAGETAEAARYIERSQFHLQGAMEHIENLETQNSAARVNVTAEDQKAYQLILRAERVLADAADPVRAETETAQVQVYLTRFGMPLAGAEALLRPSAKSGSYSSRMFDTGAYPVSESGADGIITFRRVDPGVYDLVFKFSPEDLEGVGACDIPAGIEIEPQELVTLEVELNHQLVMSEPQGALSLPYGEEVSARWEPYPGAREYGIHAVYYTEASIAEGEAGPPQKGRDIFSSSVGVEVDRVPTPFYSLSPADAGPRLRIGVMSPDRVYPAAVIGFYHPGAYFSLKVSAYGEDGRLLSDSDGYIYSDERNYPLWHIEQPLDSGLIRQGDRLVLEGAYEEALAWYRSAADSGDEVAALSAEALQTAMNFRTD